jgi:hypothetical protein
MSGHSPAGSEPCTGDNFYKQGQLLPENFEAAARDAGIDGLKVRYQPTGCGFEVLR